MNFLIVPHISTKTDVYKESDFIVWKQFVESWGENVFCYVLLHEEAEILEELQFPNVEYIKLGNWYPYTPSQVMVSDEIYSLFNPIDGKYQVDAILTSKTVLAPSLKRLFTFDRSISVPVYVVESWVPSDSHKNPLIDQRLKALSYSSCPTFFPSERERGFAADFSRKFLSSKAMADFNRNSVIRSQGIHAKKIHAHAKKTEKFDKFTFVFSARFNSNKQWDKVLEVYEDIFRMGRDVQIKAVSTTNTPKDLDKRFSKVEFIPTQSYADYLDLISKSHAAVSMSIDEGFSFGWGEHICTGNPVIFPDKDWATSLVGDVKYPYLYRSNVELIAMLKWVCDNYDKAQSKMRKYSKDFVANHDVVTAANDILTRVKETHVGTWNTLAKWAGKFSEALEDMPERFKFHDFVSHCEKKYGATFGLFTPTALAVIGAYRNIYKWLCENAVKQISPDMEFTRL